MKTRTVAVIGLGQFGTTICEELIKHDLDIIAIDNDPEKVKEVSSFVPTAFIADSTDEKALKELDFGNVEHAIVAFGNNIQATILTTVMLKELGLKRITVRCDDEDYAPILKRLGADDIISPQKMAAASFANRLENTSFVDYYSLEDDFSVIKVKVSEKYEAELISELDPRNKFDCNIILITRDGKSFAPKGTDEIKANDVVIVVGTNEDAKKLVRHFEK